jgi:hypothetical protein
MMPGVWSVATLTCHESGFSHWTRNDPRIDTKHQVMTGYVTDWNQPGSHDEVRVL